MTTILTPKTATRYLIVRDLAGQIDYYDPFQHKWQEHKYYLLTSGIAKNLFLSVMHKEFPEVPLDLFRKKQFEPAHEHPTENDLYPMGIRYYIEEE